MRRNASVLKMETPMQGMTDKIPPVQGSLLEELLRVRLKTLQQQNLY